MRCQTTAWREKEKAIRRRFSTRTEKALGQLAQRVAAGKLKDRGKIERRLRRIEARYPAVADFHQMQRVEAAGGLRVDWQMRPERRAWQETRKGRVCRAPISRPIRPPRCGRSIFS